MPKDAKGEARRLRDYYARETKCAACGKPISRRKGWTCSVKCQGRLEGQEDQLAEQ
jgi:hypothetical protein